MKSSISSITQKTLPLKEIDLKLRKLEKIETDISRVYTKEVDLGYEKKSKQRDLAQQKEEIDSYINEKLAPIENQINELTSILESAVQDVLMPGNHNERSIFENINNYKD
jgi:hypothetical protein